MKYTVVEVGSTNTKAYYVNDTEVSDAGFKTIEFKNHYKVNNQLDENDKKELIDFINSLDNDNVYVFGTSIFRKLNDDQRNEWLKEFKSKTKHDFRIVSSDEENEYTVYGAVANTKYDGNIAVMIGGGGSTELAIVKDGKIIESANSNFGAMDTSDMFPDIKKHIAITDYDEMVSKTKELVNVPKNKADILILAGGDYIYFYEELNYPVEKNKFYDNDLQPYAIDIETMDKFDRDFFYNIDLEEVCKRTNNDAWWRGTRGMRLCVKSLADILDAKYIIPTRINMIYGIMEQINSGKIK